MTPTNVRCLRRHPPSSCRNGCSVLSGIRTGSFKNRLGSARCFTQLQEEIRAGNLSVVHSKRFGRFDNFFIQDEQWARLRAGFFQRAGLPQEADQVPDCLCRRLNDAFDRFLETASGNRYATADERGWHLATDPSEKLDPLSERQLDELKDWT